MRRSIGLGALWLAMVAAVACADDGPDFSDPARTPPPPAHAVGFPSRDPQLDALPGFRQPPPGYGSVPFYWWMGDRLTTERLAWQLEQMAGMGVSGYQINYAHSDQGGRSYGLTYPSDPPLFSSEWWKLTGWFMQQAGRQGAAISLSDYTLGFGQGWCIDEILREHPEVRGMVLKAGPEGTIAPETAPWSLNPMHPQAGKWYAEKFFGQFERRFPGEGGRGLNFFFSDELGFGVSGRLWSAQFADQFRKRKGYDIVPELPALFRDIGPRTPKIRLDYNDVLVALSEECFFKPVFDWHQQRGMIMGCDHGGRGRNVVEFGDYFRTQRWNQGPGADQPNLGKNVIKAKVAASIAHLYLRPRVWLEGFYGSGWGTTSAGVVDATLANYVMGFNLLGIHGMYYSTHGGWWEWAPPDNTFRMPYWKHLRGFMDCVQRLSYLLSQGHHRCDVAILYPVAPMEAGMDGPAAVKTAFSTGEALYARGVDFDFIDFQSLGRADIAGRELRVSGEAYRVLVLPGMKAIRHATLEKALAFHRAGGIVVAAGALPEASDRLGRDDPQVAAMVRELFPRGPEPDLLARLPTRDYEGPGLVQHRKIGPRDLYAIYDAPRGAACFFRAVGAVELWDPWTGETQSLPVTEQTAAGTRLNLPLSEKEIQLIVFAPGQPTLAKPTGEARRTVLAVEGPWQSELEPTCDNRFGDFHWPPTPEPVGAEVRQFRHADETASRPGWENPAFDDARWARATCGFGVKFWKLGPLPANVDLDTRLAALAAVDPAAKVEVDGRKYAWQPYEFSWRWGVMGDPGHQGYHGLKENVSDEFLCLGAQKRGRNEFIYGAEPGGTRYYLWTTLPGPSPAEALVGGLAPAAVWLNGQRVVLPALPLKPGANPLLLRYDAPGRGYFVARRTGFAAQQAAERSTGAPAPLAMRWYDDPAVLRFDPRPQAERPAAWYRFRAAPGLKALVVPTAGAASAWIGGQPARAQSTQQGWRFEPMKLSDAAAMVALRVEQPSGLYGGAAITAPIRQECGQGTIEPGDWSKLDGLASYSGGVWYRKTIVLTPDQARSTVLLDLGRVVSSVEVRVNGQTAGIRVAPPWSLDVTRLIRPGENRIELLVLSTLANHYQTVPTRYRGDPTAGLLGPVTLQFGERP